MSLFDPAPSFRVASPTENALTALDQPLNPLATFMGSGSNDIRQNFGIGTMVRDFEIPRGVPQPPGPVEQGLAGNPITTGLVSAYEGVRGLLGAPTSGPPMSEPDYKSSPYYRKDIPWDAAMTTDRAAALAWQLDLKNSREYFGSKNLALSLGTGLLAGLMDPINFVPVFGPAARLAATAKLGTILGHGLIGASEAAINTAVFGALTSPTRKQFGDDVSFEASINNIAFAAVAGAVFGGVGGVIARARNLRELKANQALKLGTETIQNLKDSRAVLNDAVTGLVTDGEVKLSPASQSVIERINSEVTDKRDATRSLTNETAGVVGTKAGEVAISPSGARINVKPEVVELSSLQHATGSLQVRNRINNAASDAQIQDIALKLDPARLMPNVDASQGAPIVGGDNVIDSGNGRVAALRLAYETYPDKGAAYKQHLVDSGYADAANMQQPVLISRRTTDLSPQARAEFNGEINGPTVAKLTAVELAAMDRGALTDSTLDAHVDGAPVTAASQRGFVSRFLANLPINERNSLVDPEGNLSADGARRIENALVAGAYGDVDASALRRFAEATDDNTHTVVGALADVAGKWIAMRRAIQRGEITPDFDATKELTDALNKLAAWRDQAAREKRPVGIVIKEGLGQGDILAGQISAPTRLFIRSFYQDDNFTQVASRENIAGRLRDLADAALELGQPDMLGDAYAATKLGVLHRVYGDLETDLLQARDVPASDAQIGSEGGQSRSSADQQIHRGPTGENGSGGGAQADRPVSEAVAAATSRIDAPVTLHRGASSAEIGSYATGEFKFRAGQIGVLTSDDPGAGKYFAGNDGSVTTLTLPAGAKILDRAAGAGEGDLIGPGFDELNRAAGARAEREGISQSEALRQDLVAQGYDAIRYPSRGKYNVFEILDPAKLRPADTVEQSVFQAPDGVASVVKARADIKARQPARSIDELYAVAPEHQATLDALGKELEGDGAKWKNPGVKDRANAAEKMARKSYKSTSQLTDVVRGGFVVKTPMDADRVVSGLASRFEIVDEGWSMSVAGYFDRKVLVRFGDGTVGEVQFWHPDMLEAKNGPAGHSLYEQMRGLKDDDPKFQALVDKQKAVYLAAIESAGDDWLPVLGALTRDLDAAVGDGGRPTPGNAASNAAADIGRPESKTSAASTPSHLPPGDNIAQASPFPTDAGRDSQSNNVGSMPQAIGRPAIDMQEPRPEPPPDGLDQAAARVGTVEDMRALAEQHGVDPKTGDFIEQADIDQLRKEGRLTPEDEAELAGADETKDNADAWAEVLRAAAACVMR